MSEVDFDLNYKETLGLFASVAAGALGYCARKPVVGVKDAIVEAVNFNDGEGKYQVAAIVAEVALSGLAATYTAGSRLNRAVHQIAAGDYPPDANIGPSDV